VRQRLAVYHDQTRPLVDYYQSRAQSGDAAAPRYVCVEGEGDIDGVRQRIIDALAD